MLKTSCAPLRSPSSCVNEKEFTYIPMRESNFDVFDPSLMVMDSDCYSKDGCDHGNFGFAFNDRIFSDRVLRIHIPIESTPGCTKPSIPSVRVETIHVSSPILGARSPFFYKLFSNGMRESAKCYVTLRINALEEAAFMELLNFMYSSNLTVTTAPAVLDVLKVADKFEVASCIRHCGRLLRNLPMTPESLLVYLDLPTTILTDKAFQPLTVAAKQFYAVHYKDITKLQDEILGLPLAGVEDIIASDDLHVKSKDTVCRFVLKWTWAQYPNPKDCCEIIATRLAKFIRYPFMTRRMLTQLITCTEFDPEFAQKVVAEALSFKAKVPLPHKQHTYMISDKSSNNINNRWFVERAYKYRPVKMVKFEEPRPHCVVYMDLKRDVCASLFPSDAVFSKSFYLGGHGGQRFNLMAKCNIDCLGFYLCMLEKESVAFAFAFEYEFAARSMPAEEFVSRLKGNYTFTSGKALGLLNLFAIPWSSFIGEDSVYFIDGVLHLKVELYELTN